MIQILLIFTQHLFLFQTPSQDSHHVPLAMTVFEACLVFDDLESFEEYWSGIFWNVSWDFSDVSLMVMPGLWAFVHSHHIIYQEYILSTLFITVDIDLSHVAEVVFVKDVHSKVTSPSCSSSLLLSKLLKKKVVMCSSHVMGRDYALPPWRWSIYISSLEFCRDLCIPLH